VIAPAHGDQALGDERAIEPDQWCDIGDGTERHPCSMPSKSGSGHLAGPEAARAQARG